MLRLCLNSDGTNTIGAIKPCQRPSQKPATTFWSLVVPLNWLTPGAHPASMFSNKRTRTSRAKDFIAIPPLRLTTKGGREKSHQCRVHRASLFSFTVPRKCVMDSNISGNPVNRDLGLVAVSLAVIKLRFRGTLFPGIPSTSSHIRLRQCRGQRLTKQCCCRGLTSK